MITLGNLLVFLGGFVLGMVFDVFLVSIDREDWK